MKTRIKTIALTAALGICCASPALGQLNIPGDGSDGALLIQSNTVIDLSQAVTGSWDANNTANAGKGIYDSNKWAVVFKYSGVVISNGATVTFANHPSKAPVVWLVNGHVTIQGAVSLDGGSFVYAPNLPEGGPGGFRGGFGAYTQGLWTGAGFGPGGGGNPDRHGGSYGSYGYSGSTLYGNPSLLPLIGGSGGAGDTDNNSGSTTSPQSGSGGAGGGAILIACSGTVFIGSTGEIRANGGDGGGNWNNMHSAGGSGGGIRIVCNTVSGTGFVRALGGGGYRAGGLGRIRVERVTAEGSLQLSPDPSVVPLLAGDTPLIWLPTTGPVARIISIGSVAAPADPRASFGTYGPDVALPQSTNAQVVVETVNAETASIVKVRVTPRANANYTETTATLTQTNSQNPLVLRWTATVPVNNGYSAVQARVIRP